ncbi:hypothetical protein AB0B28_03190 [Glycomyces sp. NPDC046736]|uniref:hypothetical protein n=1 Tax=Glycomyces sp. NPDC046736 TaxID=3155615 RepID=UPI0033C948C3
MKRMTMTFAALAAAAAFTAGFASPAQADTEAAACSAVATENRSVWAAPGTGEGTVGGVVAGRTYSADCSLTPGEAYTACGQTSDQWARVNFSGDAWGYLPSACLSWAS